MRTLCVDTSFWNLVFDTSLCLWVSLNRVFRALDIKSAALIISLKSLKTEIFTSILKWRVMRSNRLPSAWISHSQDVGLRTCGVVYIDFCLSVRLDTPVSVDMFPLTTILITCLRSRSMTIESWWFGRESSRYCTLSTLIHSPYRSVIACYQVTRVNQNLASHMMCFIID